jgi:23S rRNA (cytidine2498-2'-O)-methyltransferase
LSSKTGIDSTSSPSRAGGKIDEVLQLLQELEVDHNVFPKWLELGAAPGGMTQRLIDWGANVTAVDLAEIKKDIINHARVQHLKINAQELPTAESFDALLSDMNGPFINSAKIVARLGSTMTSGRLIVYVLKLNKSPNPLDAIEQVKSIFSSHGIQIILVRHLFHNREEVTFICKKA